MKYKITTKEGLTILLDDPYEVYEYLIKKIYKQDINNPDEDSHFKAEDAQCWCELANTGDEYVAKHFKIECVYNF
jgi:hypothetical protein